MKQYILINTDEGMVNINMEHYLLGQLKVWQNLIENGMKGMAASSLLEISPETEDLIDVINTYMDGDEDLVQFIHETKSESWLD